MADFETASPIPDGGESHENGPKEIREDRVSKKALEEQIDLSGQKLQIHIKNPKTGATDILQDLEIVPIEVAKICSKKVAKIYIAADKLKVKKKQNRAKQLDDFVEYSGHKATSGNVLTLDKDAANVPLFAYKWILDWMNACHNTQSVAQVDYLSSTDDAGNFSISIEDEQQSAPAPIRGKKQKQQIVSKPLDDYINETDGISKVVNIMQAAHKLEVPFASFNKFIVKKLERMAREFLVDLNLVKKAYNGIDASFRELGLREICTKSIFENWYNWLLDTEDKEEYMCQLADLRDEFPELDDDLHARVTEKDQALTKFREQKATKKREEEEGYNNDGGQFENGAAGDTGFDGQENGFGASQNFGNDAEKPDWDRDSGVADVPDGVGDWADEANAASAASASNAVAANAVAAQPSPMW